MREVASAAPAGDRLPAVRPHQPTGDSQAEDRHPGNSLASVRGTVPNSLEDG